MIDPAVPTPVLAPDAFAVLHALRVHGPASRDVLVELCWLCPEHVDLALHDLDASGLVARSDPRWEATADGRDAHAVAAVADAAAHRTLVQEAYRSFVVHDAAFDRICRGWEARGGDVADVAVLDQITVLERQVAALTAALAEAMPRFGRYGPRFTALRNRMGAGASVGAAAHCPYRDVWAELRTDLLVTLGTTVEAAP